VIRHVRHIEEIRGEQSRVRQLLVFITVNRFRHLDGCVNIPVGAGRRFGACTEPEERIFRGRCCDA
jgi:hypothetical protein